jgi:predicted ferric reductase
VSTHTWWYVARASGLVAWSAAGLSIVLGLLLAGRLGRRPTAAWRQDLHRFVGGLAVAFLGLHLTALVLDPTVPFGIAALTVPLASTWRPGAVAWGVVAAWLLVVVEGSSLVKRRLPHRVWRRIHTLGLVVWIAGTAHAVTAGTDGSAARWIALIGSALMFNLAVLRTVGRRVPAAPPRGRVAAATRSASTLP